MTKRRRPVALRKPASPHRPDDRLVPVPGCACDTCQRARDDRLNDLDARHWRRIGDLVGIDDDDDASNR